MFNISDTLHKDSLKKLIDHPTSLYWIIIFITFLVITFVVVYVFNQKIEADKMRRTQEAACIISVYSNDVFNNVDNMLSEIIDKLDPNDFKMELKESRRVEIEQILKKAQKRYKGVAVIALADDFGDMFVDSVRELYGRSDLNVSSRIYFQKLSTTKTFKPFISSPNISKTTGKWVIHVVRRLNHVDYDMNGNFIGSFAGVIIASVLVDEVFVDMFKQINFGKNSVAALRHKDNYYVFRLPFEPEVFGRPIPTTALSRMFLEQGYNSGSTRFYSAINGNRMYGSFCKLADYEIYAIVAYEG